MSKRCAKCGNAIPNRVKIDGKSRVIKNRKYCLECSPFGEHNTKKLHRKDVPNGTESKICKSCGNEFSTKGQVLCGSCQYKKQLAKRYEKVYGIVGTACWKCNYDKGMVGTPMLDFHHVDPKQKCFNVSRREIAAMKWDRVLKEMKKCVLLCCRCHREHHAGFVSDKEVNSLHDKWLSLAT
jgi:hypothetical protein